MPRKRQKQTIQAIAAILAVILIGALVAYALPSLSPANTVTMDVTLVFRDGTTKTIEGTDGSLLDEIARYLRFKGSYAVEPSSQKELVKVIFTPKFRYDTIYTVSKILYWYDFTQKVTKKDEPAKTASSYGWYPLDQSNVQANGDYPPENTWISMTPMTAMMEDVVRDIDELYPGFWESPPDKSRWLVGYDFKLHLAFHFTDESLTPKTYDSDIVTSYIEIEYRQSEPPWLNFVETEIIPSWVYRD